MCQPLRIFGGLSLPLLLFLSLFLSVAETKLIKRPTAVRPRAISDGHSIFERLCDRIPNLFEYPSNSKKKKKKRKDYRRSLEYKLEETAKCWNIYLA